MKKFCVDCSIDFVLSKNELIQYKKVDLELPNKCFKCRIKHHFAFWNFGKFRKTISGLSGKGIITVHPMRAKYPIYSSHEWYGDSWDPIDFGQDYNPKESFFKQFYELQTKIPRPHQIGKNSTNSDWCDDAWESKNCYLSRSILRCENLSYGYRTLDTKDSFDIVLSFNLQNSYDCLFCYNSYNLKFSEISKDCIDSSFLFDCRNCQDCFMCFNLRGKKYCILNEQYMKEKYIEKLKEFDTGSYSSLLSLKKMFIELKKKNVIHKENFNLKTNNSIGNYLTNCNNCINVFSWENSENCYNSVRGLNTKDCIDQTGVWNTEVSGNNSCCTGGFELKYSMWSNGSYSEYLDICDEVQYCFGCVGLRNKKYCILNKQYEKEEYEILKNKIISQMKKDKEYGEFFPYYMSMCDYNFSTGYIYFNDVTKIEIDKLGGYWNEDDNSSADGMLSSLLPDHINDVPVDISETALLCERSGYRYNISKEELMFYKRNNIALPRNHFDIRIIDKVKQTAVLESYYYKCCYCSSSIQAYYPRNWEYENIACEKCYTENLN